MLDLYNEFASVANLDWVEPTPHYPVISIRASHLHLVHPPYYTYIYTSIYYGYEGNFRVCSCMFRLLTLLGFTSLTGYCRLPPAACLSSIWSGSSMLCYFIRILVQTSNLEFAYMLCYAMRCNVRFLHSHMYFMFPAGSCF